jgi:transposase-like protein
MGKRRNRRKFTAEQKAAILRRHLVDKVPVSDLCDEYHLQPSVFYTWQRQVMDNLGVALEAGEGPRRRSESREVKLARENEALRAKLAKKDHVIAEISEEHVALKKELGEL